MKGVLAKLGLCLLVGGCVQRNADEVGCVQVYPAGCSEGYSSWRSWELGARLRPWAHLLILSSPGSEWAGKYTLEYKRRKGHSVVWESWHFIVTQLSPREGKS